MSKNEKCDCNGSFQIRKIVLLKMIKTKDTVWFKNYYHPPELNQLGWDKENYQIFMSNKNRGYENINHVQESIAFFY